MGSFHYDEKNLSQIFTSQVARNLRYEYLTSVEVLAGQLQLPVNEEASA